mmetsp:Transcript_88267/g.189483  ORF Transcript_88267/g.189483 Transcript_88267/m.189483 type:complete len:205 (+) Transcript_88267:155-769(+)
MSSWRQTELVQKRRRFGVRPWRRALYRCRHASSKCRGRSSARFSKPVRAVLSTLRKPPLRVLVGTGRQRKQVPCQRSCYLAVRDGTSRTLCRVLGVVRWFCHSSVRSHRYCLGTSASSAANLGTLMASRARSRRLSMRCASVSSMSSPTTLFSPRSSQTSKHGPKVCQSHSGFPASYLAHGWLRLCLGICCCGTKTGSKRIGQL